MKNKPYLLDTSALLTLIENEPGADRVEQVLKEANVLIASIALTEVYYISLQECGSDEADLRYALLKNLDTQILWSLEEPVILTAARFKASHRLSLADSIIAAFAFQHGATLLHKDPEFQALGSQVQLEPLPFKSR